MTTANVRPISGLPPASALDGTEVFPVSQQGAAVSVATGRLAALVAPLAAPLVPPPSKASVGLGNVDNLSAAQLAQPGNAVGDRIKGSFPGGVFQSEPGLIKVANGVNSTDGSFATDGTNSWQPSTFGNFMAPGQDIKVYPTRGTPKDASGNPDYKMFTANLIQARGDGAVEKETNGQFINFESVGGAVSQAALNTTNACGQLVSVRQRPSQNGEKPPTTWGVNIDFHIAPNSGNVQSYCVEYDINNFNKDAAAGSGALSAAVFMGGISAFPSTAYIYAGAGTTNPFSGTVTSTASVVTWVSGNQFTPAIKRIRIGGVSYRVAYTDATHLAAREPIPVNASAVAYSAKSDMVHDGILFSGEYQVSDSDIHLSTFANAAITVDGSHLVGLSLNGDTAKYAIVMGSGQGVYFNALSNSLSYDISSTYLQYKTNNGIVFQISDSGTVITPKLYADGTGVLQLGNSSRGPSVNILDAGSSIANLINFRASPTGFGPTISAGGSDANVPLNLQAQGSAPVQAVGNFSVTGASSFSGISTFNGRTRFSNSLVSAAGTTQATATPLLNDISFVTSGSGGVVLQNLTGQRQEVFNRSGAAINVYPNSSAQIEALGINNPVSLASGAHATFVFTSATQCYQGP